MESWKLAEEKVLILIARSLASVKLTNYSWGFLIDLFHDLNQVNIIGKYYREISNLLINFLDFKEQFKPKTTMESSRYKSLSL